MRRTVMRRTVVRRTVPLLCFCVFVMPAYSGQILENDSLRITFGSPDEGYAITSIENKKSDDARFIYADASTSANFWSLVLSSVNPTGGIDRIVLDNHVRAAAKWIDRNGDETRFSGKAWNCRMARRDLSTLLLPSRCRQATRRANGGCLSPVAA